jgi:hypothetical protein
MFAGCEIAIQRVFEFAKRVEVEAPKFGSL